MAYRAMEASKLEQEAWKLKDTLDAATKQLSKKIGTKTINELQPVYEYITNMHRRAHEMLDPVVPEELTQLEYGLIQNSLEAEQKVYRKRFEEARSKKKKLSIVTDKFMAWMMLEAKKMSPGKRCVDDRVKKALEDASELYLRRSKGQEVHKYEWAELYGRAGEIAEESRGEWGVFVIDVVAQASFYEIVDSGCGPYFAAGTVEALFRPFRLKMADKLIELYKSAK